MGQVLTLIIETSEILDLFCLSSPKCCVLFISVCLLRAEIMCYCMQCGTIFLALLSFKPFATYNTKSVLTSGVKNLVQFFRVWTGG